MNYILKLGIGMLGLFGIASCNTSEKKTKEINEDEWNKNAHSYSIDTAGISVVWTAYKFTEKIGVYGTFDNFKFSAVNEAESIEQLLESSKIVIYTESVNSNNEKRDPKLRTFFFQVFNADTIRGSISEATQGKGIIDLVMNNIAKPLEYTYSIMNDTLLATATIDLGQWEGTAAMQSLNKVCYDLHTGADGISKLWPDVDVVIHLPILAKIN